MIIIIIIVIIIIIIICYDNSNYSANTIHSPIYYVNNNFNCPSVQLPTIIRIILNLFTVIEFVYSHCCLRNVYLPRIMQV